jgi:transposase
MKQPPQFERDALEHITQPVLVDVILRQQEAIQQLFEEVGRLKGIINRNSSDSSKPPSSDFLKKSEIAKAETIDVGKQKAGGQPGHPGATRKGFGRVDRFEVVKPQE